MQLVYREGCEEGTAWELSLGPALLLTYYRACRGLFNLTVDQLLNQQN